MGIISNMDTQHMIFSLPSESNHVMSTNAKVSYLLIIMLISFKFQVSSFICHIHDYTEIV